MKKLTSSRNRFRTFLLVLTCGAFLGVFLSGCKGEPKSEPGGNGLTPEARKAKRGEE